MILTNVKITYAEAWLPFHHRFLIHMLSFCRQNILKKDIKIVNLAHDKEEQKEYALNLCK